MASADLRDELTCSICLDLYTQPVTLPCGHSFCRHCIGNVLDTQDGSGAYKCPECRAEFQERPALVKVRKLHNIAESFQSTHPEQEEIKIPCTYCILSTIPAAKTCLMCEASLCDIHLRVHCKSEEHVLTEPTTSVGNRKCSVHKKVLEYYCCEDAACICVSCSLAEKHMGHQVESLNEAFEKKKEKLRNILQKLTSQRVEAEKKVQSLEKLRRQVQEKAAVDTERVTALIRDIRERLEAMDKRVLSEISRQEEKVSLRVSDLIRQLEIKKEELSRKMGDIEELCNMTDPVTVLQGRESDRADYCDAEKDPETHDIKVHDVGDLDEELLSVILHSGLAGIFTKVNKQCSLQNASGILQEVKIASDISMDIDTAADNVHLSDRNKTVSRSRHNRSYTKERFYRNQVLSSEGFSTGRHYWEVDCSEGGWAVGMAYPSIDRNGWGTQIGCNAESWGLKCFDSTYSLKHNNESIDLSQPASSWRVGIFLDYKYGRLAFYELGDPIRHLHTFRARFKGLLHAVIGIYKDDSCVRIVDPQF